MRDDSDRRTRGMDRFVNQAAFVLSSDPSAPSKARYLLAEALADRVSGERLTRSQLALSEVVSNAVRHGGPERSVIELVIAQSDTLVNVRVIQSGPVRDRPSIIDMPDTWSTGGYGLGIVDAIADRWGVHLDPPSVWFELDL